eukprot:5125297-Pleurochrysis_carterae.AAC.1
MGSALSCSSDMLRSGRSKAMDSVEGTEIGTVVLAVESSEERWIRLALVQWRSAASPTAERPSVRAARARSVGER